MEFQVAGKEGLIDKKWRYPQETFVQIPEADVGVRYVTTWKVVFQVKK